jgi:hypothetical protein
MGNNYCAGAREKYDEQKKRGMEVYTNTKARASVKLQAAKESYGTYKERAKEKYDEARLKM